jgi:hypothetical protein
VVLIILALVILWAYRRQQKRKAEANGYMPVVPNLFRGGMTPNENEEPVWGLEQKNTSGEMIYHTSLFID